MIRPAAARLTHLAGSRRASRSRGMTLIEVGVCLAVLTVVGAALTPTLNRQRQTAQSVGSLANLHQIGQMSTLYGNANDDQFATYSWYQNGSRSMRYEVVGEGTVRPRDTSDAAAYQLTDIIRRVTGRVNDVERFPDWSIVDIWPHRRLNHLLLQDFAGSMLPDPIFHAPADGVTRRFAAEPLSILDNVPVANADDVRFRRPAYREALPYMSSYHSTTFLFQTGTQESSGVEQPILPLVDSVNLWNSDRNINDRMLARNRVDTTFPSLKVQYFEEFDWLARGGRYYAFDDARPHVLMVDGSAARRRSSDAVDGVNPDDPGFRLFSTFRPLFFGWPSRGTQEDVNQKFRFTDGGLAGVDFTTTSDAPDGRRGLRGR